MDIRTDNDFMFGSDGERLAPMLVVDIRTKQQAYRTAAWIETMGFILPDEDEGDNNSTYEEIRQAIRNT